MKETKRPIKKYNCGTVSVSVWENEHDGKKYNGYTIQKRYKNEKSGEWENSNSFSTSDLYKLQTIIEFIGGTSVKVFTDIPEAEPPQETSRIDLEDVPF